MTNNMSTTFRIATWNLDHPKHGNRFPEQMKKLEEVSAAGGFPDILVLTETSPGADLSYMGYVGVSSFPYRPLKNSKKERNSSAIWSKWPIECVLSTYDDETATCAKIKTSFGSLLVYGTILTYDKDRWPDETGARWSLHDREIERQGGDWNQIHGPFPDERQGGDWNRIRSLFPDVPFIVAGDFNQVRYPEKDLFSRKGKPLYYFSPKGRCLLNSALEKNNLTCLTEVDFGAERMLKPDPRKGYYRHNVDHICVTAGRFDVQEVGAWDHFTKSHELTDHNGVFVDLAVSS